VILAPLVHLAFALSGNPPVAAEPSPMERSLDDAVQFFESFDDERAALKFRALLAGSPPGEIAAKAHLYLGLIAFDNIKPDLAKLEFRRALEANPGVDVPPKTSPKARLAFAAALHNFELEMEGAAAAPKRPRMEPAPAAATAVSPAEVEGATAPRSHTAAYVLGGLTLALGAVAIYGGIDLVNYNSMVNTGNGSGGSALRPTYTSDQLASGRGQASFWAIGWPVSAGLAAAGLVGTFLTW
jgi:hypothetical protein